jgi:hypothetical protein
LLRKPITTEFIATAKTYYHRVYCNGLQQLTFVAIKVYCNKMKVITTKNFVAINLFSCSDERKMALSHSVMKVIGMGAGQK